MLNIELPISSNPAIDVQNITLKSILNPMIKTPIISMKRERSITIRLKVSPTE